MIEAAPGELVEAAQERPPHTSRHGAVEARLGRNDGGAGGSHADSLGRVGVVVCKPMAAMLVRLCRQLLQESAYGESCLLLWNQRDMKITANGASVALQRGQRRGVFTCGFQP